MADIEVDDPSLIVLVGAAGSGKSTFAARHFAADEILSSDRFRAIVSGDEADQAATKAAFVLLHRTLSTRLGERRLTVVDATSVQPAARRALVARADAAGVPVTAIVLDLPAATVVARNAARPARTVDMAVVRRQLAGVRASLDGPAPPLRGEGFRQIVVLRDPGEVDRVRILRRPT
jgi:predicted kinase